MRKSILLFITIYYLLATSYFFPVLAQDSTSSAVPNPSITSEPPVTNPSSSASITSAPSPTPSPEVITPTATPSHNQINPEVQTKGIFEKNELLSAKIKSNTKIFPLSKKNFQAKENIEIEIKNTYNRDVAVSVKDQDGKNFPAIIQQKYVGDDSKISIIPPPRFRPGKYKLTIIDAQGNSIEQDFTWGVLAINTHKSIYLPNEKVYVAISVLNEAGSMVCDASVYLEIVSPSGKKISLGTENNTIIVNPDCYKRDVHPNPDYQTDFDLGEELGAYQMNLSAVTKNGRYEISDAFEVRASVLFDVERIATTRIFPLNNYEVKMRITAQQDFAGSIIETVPEIFKILPSTGSRSYDEISTEEAKLEQDQTLITQTNSLSLPFSGEFAKTQEFGVIPDNLFLRLRYLMLGNQKHDGIDYALPEGTPVLAVDAGEIIQSGEGDYGITVAIKHSWGTSYYGHLSETTFETGKLVNKGDIIGYSGNTGLSTGPHLHFALKPNDEDPGNGFNGKVDPIAYIQNSNSSLALNTNKNILGAGTSIFQTKKIKWNLSLTKGETITIGYIFDPPEISPQFYLLGPLQFQSVIRNSQFENNLINRLPEGVSQNSESTTSATLESTISAQLQTQYNNITIQQFSNETMEQSNNDSIIFSESRQWQIASDADVQIDASLSAANNDHKNKPNLVFISDQVGYIFYANSGGSSAPCVYQKTTNGGSTWNGEVTLDSQSNPACEGIAVWYDQWTPGDTTGSYIHIAMINLSDLNKSVFYQRIDTANNDAQLSSDRVVVISPSVTPVRNDQFYITKVKSTTAETVYLAYSSANSCSPTCNKVVQCALSSGCDLAGEWSDVGTSPLDAGARDPVILLSISNGDLILIRHDVSTEDLEYQTWNGSSWSGSWVDISTNCPDNGTTNPGSIAAAQRRYNYYIYLTCVFTPATVDTAEVQVWLYDGTTWSQKTDVVPDTELSATDSLFNADIAVDEETGDVYVIYNRGTAITATNVYYKKSTDSMSSWSAESAALNTSVTNTQFQYVWLNVVDSDRIFSAFVDRNLNDLYGALITDLTPPLMDEVMRHGDWWSRAGKRRSFSW